MIKRKITIPAGKVVEARFASHAPSFKKPSSLSESRRAGMRYEAKAHKHIAQIVLEGRKQNPHLRSMQSPWMVFRSEHDAPGYLRYCQPDVLLFDEWQRKITIIEVKLQHCLEAYEQVRLLYEPVLRHMYPQHDIAVMELVLWHDPHVAFPERYYFESNILQAEAGRFAIHIWNPRYDKKFAQAQAASGSGSETASAAQPHALPLPPLS